MTTQKIEIEGLPEGWKAKEFRLGEINEPYFDPATKSICRLLLGSTVGVLIVEKIQPSRIVFESTTESRKAKFGDWIYNNGAIEQWRSEKKSQSTYKIWREVKETDIPLTKEEPNVKIGVSQGDVDEPKLSLSVDQCKQLCSRNFNLVQEIMSIAREFIKDK